jgi:O-antigen biosynthesis protein
MRSSNGQGLLTNCQPTKVRSGDFDSLSREAGRQATLLRAEVRHLSTQLNRQSAELDRLSAELKTSLSRTQELEAAFATAMAERNKILESRIWRVTRATQRMVASCVSAMLRLRSLATKHEPLNPKLPTSDTTPPSPEQVEPSSDDNSYEGWARSYDSLSDDDRHLIKARIAGLIKRPVISIIVSNGGTHEARSQTIASLENQLYSEWELCLSNERSINGTFVTFMKPGDILPEHALFEVAMTLDAHPDADLIYTDEDVIDDNGLRHKPVFKPAFNIELLLGTNMIGQLSVYRRSLLEKLDFAIEPISRDQEHDLTIQVALATCPARIKHIPAVLYHRRVSLTDRDPASRPDRLRQSIVEVPGLPNVQRAPIAGHPEWRRVIWPLPNPVPRVSMIVLTRDKAELLARCIVGLLYRTDYPDLEVIVIDNDSREAGTLSLFEMLRKDLRVRVLSVPGPFNFSVLNNVGVRAAAGQVIVMINNDIDVIEGGWLREMVSHAIRPDVGAVGAKLIYSDEHIQHAGIVLGVGRHNGGPGIAGHFGHFAEADDEGYLGQLALTRELSAVTGACLALRREVWDTVGGLNEVDLPVAYNDVDLCLRIRARGLRIIWTPFAELYHLESASRGREETPDQRARAAREAQYMRDQWGSTLDNDPFYNPNFDRSSHLFELARPPHPRSWRIKTVSATGTTL